jgi:ATP-dependent DNA helicase DinG
MAVPSFPADSKREESVPSPALQEQILRFFEPEGALARFHKGYEHRPRQRDMALAVAEAIEGRATLLAEAETGIGKTLAYLAPAVLSGRKTVVSTSTKALQAQIWQKDLPLLREALGFDFRAALLKGRKNYLCLWKMAQAPGADMFASPKQARAVAALQQWAEHSETGETSEFSALPEDSPLWDELTVGSDECLGRKCTFYEKCFVTRARAKAAEASLVVVNHHLYFADLAVRDSLFGEVIPGHEAVIFDEAHALERTATQFFGVSLSRGAFLRLSADIRRAANGETEEFFSVLDAMTEASVRFMDSVAGFLPAGGRAALEPQVSSPACAALRSALETLAQALRRRAAPEEDGGEWQALLGRTEEISAKADFLARAEDASFAYFAEHSERSTFLRAYPIDVAPIFAEKIFGHGRAVVLASATLRAAGSFRFLRARLGVPEEAAEAFFESPFDPRSQAMLYVPANLPPPTQKSDFLPAAMEEIRSLLNISGGRAFLLFTSFDMLDAFHEGLANLPCRMLRQGDAPREALLEEFRSGDPAVLLGTASFWEGVDVQGPALVLVAVDRLPFEVPDDPLLKARVAHIEERGGNAFFDYQVPQAALTLKQGFGRLIRSRRDRGLLVLLDTRSVNRGYGRAFLSTLPPYPLTRDRNRAGEFLRTC